MFVNNNKIVSL